MDEFGIAGTLDSVGWPTRAQDGSGNGASFQEMQGTDEGTTYAGSLENGSEAWDSGFNSFITPEGQTVSDWFAGSEYGVCGDVPAPHTEDVEPTLDGGIDDGDDDSQEDGAPGSYHEDQDDSEWLDETHPFDEDEEDN